MTRIESQQPVEANLFAVLANADASNLESVARENEAIDPSWVSGALGMVQMALDKPKEKDGVITRLTKTMAREIASYSGKEQDKIVRLIVAMNKRVKDEKITATPGYTLACYTEVLPALLRSADLGNEFLNNNGYNGPEQVVSFMTQVLKAESLAETGGVFRIYGQMCAQYQSGEEHSQDSFSNGLLPRISENEVKRVMSPVANIAGVLTRFGVSVEVVNPQLTGTDAREMLAMVPATVWGYTDKGRLGEMIMTLSTHAEAIRGFSGQFLDSYDVKAKPANYSENGIVSDSVIAKTMKYADLYDQVWRAYATHFGLDDERTWIELEPKDIKAVHRWIGEEVFDNGSQGAFADVSRDWDTDELATFRVMYRVLMEEKWGTLSDTEKFYAREVTRRAGALGDSWKHRVDTKEEAAKLVGAGIDSGHAEDLVDWSVRIANIGIGARAIFNTSLYMALGDNLAELNNGHDMAVMWPLEEDVDRWGLLAMNLMYNMRTGEKNPNAVAPIVYPSKKFRQPLDQLSK